MSVQVFFNPEIVEQMASRGIRRRPPPTDAPRGFVLGRRVTCPQGTPPVTHVVDDRGPVVITGPRRMPGPPAPPALAAPGPRTALELAEECERLRRTNQQLTDEVLQLRAEIRQLRTGGHLVTPQDTLMPSEGEIRFSLLELT